MLDFFASSHLKNHPNQARQVLSPLIRERNWGPGRPDVLVKGMAHEELDQVTSTSSEHKPRAFPVNFNFVC